MKRARNAKESTKSRKAPRTGSPRGASTSNQFKKLPIELVSHIFVLRYRDFLNGANHDRRPDFSAAKTAGLGVSPLSQKPPLILSGVCRYFREVAISTPALWARIERQKLRTAEDRTSWLDICLQRSAGFPIYIALNWLGPRGEEIVPLDADTRDLELTLSSLLPHVARWRDLSVNFYDLGLALLFFDRLNAVPTLPLESLHLQVTDFVDSDESEDGSSPTNLPFPACAFPSLRKLGIFGIPFSEPWSNFPFKNLISLELSWIPSAQGFNLAQLSKLLQASPSLESFHLRGPPRTFQEIDGRAHSVSLDKLQSLTLASMPNADIFITAARLIRAKNLETLILRSLFDEDFEPAILALGDGRSRTGYRNISRLEIDGIEVYSRGAAEQAYMEMFKSMPGINHLSVNFRNSHDTSSLEALKACEARGVNTKMLLPKLKTLQVNHLPSDRIVSLLSCRKANHRPVATVQLNGHETWSAGELRDIQRYVKNLEFFYPSDHPLVESESEADD